MKKPFFWEKAKKDLIKKDKKLGRIIKNYPKDFLFSKSDPFYTLARSIVGQQISVVAAQAVWDRYEKKIKRVSPKNTLNMHFMTLKACGLSRQKISYLKSLSINLIEKKINPDKWDDYSDDQIIEELIKIKGVGRWTAEMFLIFNLCRPDVFPADDLGLIKGICNCYNINYPITKEHAIRLSHKWKPYRSVATWYFWRSLDPIPVEY
jgi:DNA-3-methyladenine glycosylase II|tara:strand:+ start:58 stop:678 length:621 start_codon:yes stop_codon:yes gene_type:complete